MWHLGKFPNNPRKEAEESSASFLLFSRWGLTIGKQFFKFFTFLEIKTSLSWKWTSEMIGVPLSLLYHSWETPLYFWHTTYRLLDLYFARSCNNDSPQFTSNTNRCHMFIHPTSGQALAELKGGRMSRRRARPPLVTEVRHLTRAAGPDRGQPTTDQSNTYTYAV